MANNLPTVSWSALPLTGVTPRSSFTLTKVINSNNPDNIHTLILFGGFGYNNEFDDFYIIKLDISNFTVNCQHITPVEKNEKLNRVGHSAVYLPSGMVYYYGGFNGKKYLNYGLLFDYGNSNVLVEKEHYSSSNKGIGLNGSRDHTMVLINTDKTEENKNSESNMEILLFGGWNGIDQFNDLFKIDEFWNCNKIEVNGQKTPSPRRGHSASVSGNLMYIFGGIMGYSTYLNDMWVYNPSTQTWDSPPSSSNAPTPRAWHTAVTIGDKDRYILIFGGTSGRNNFYNDIYIYDTLDNLWLPGPIKMDGSIPKSVCSHSAAIVGNIMCIFGGLINSYDNNRVQPCDDFYILKLEKILEYIGK